MAEQKTFDKTRAARRRLALLVLSGDQPAPATPCPEPAELAALVEGRLEPAREETCLAHLAGCDRCCALWLQLDRHRQEQAATGARGRLLRLVGRPRALTVAGSLLAARLARTFSTFQPPPGSCAMRPACAAFCSAVCEMPSRRATSRCEGTSASEAAAIMM